jgi:putative nucleotidyltransferase with HDIG domain
MKQVKTIPIDQLKPGMFIVGMDQPWYRTPFLLHKRLIRHQHDIDLLRQHGIREVKIDPGQGLDVELVPSGDAPPPPSAQDTDAALQPNLAGKPTSAEKPFRPAFGTERNATQQLSPGTQQGASAQAQDSISALQSNHPVKLTAPEMTPQAHDREEIGAAQPPLTQESTPLPSHAQKQAAAAQETYREATCSMERVFEALETGLIPQTETVRTVVTNVLSRVLENRTSMLSLISLQKMKRFDRTLASHALDVCTLSLIVAHDYGVAEEDLEALGAGALLHDIGYVRLPRNLYRKSHELTEEERAMMQQHPALGLAILRDAQEDREAVVRIVAEHHECINGTGFPHKLRGEALSVLAQLVSLVDVYDGLVSRRGGHPAMLPHDAIRQLFHLGDTGLYAKDLIQTMIGTLGVYPISSLVLLNTGEQAVVVEMNPTQRLKPVVKVITGPQGESILPAICVDLGAQTAAAPARTITKVLDPVHERVNVAMFLEDVHEEVA